MSVRLFALLATAILLASGSALAQPEFTTFDANFTQQGTSNALNVSMIFRAFSPTRYLALGGGFTVRCNGSTAGQINAKNINQALVFGSALQVLVPASPTTYGVPDTQAYQRQPAPTAP